MKKCIAVCLASILLFVGFTSCNRRDQYRDPVETVTGEETTASVTDAGTTAPDNMEILPSPLGTGSPYQDMDGDALKALYFASPMTSLPFGSVYNTPYYYIFSHSRHAYGGVAYSKLTGKMILLCKEMGKPVHTCDAHEHLLFHLTHEFDGAKRTRHNPCAEA